VRTWSRGLRELWRCGPGLPDAPCPFPSFSPFLFLFFSFRISQQMRAEARSTTCEPLRFCFFPLLFSLSFSFFFARSRLRTASLAIRPCVLDVVAAFPLCGAPFFPPPPPLLFFPSLGARVCSVVNGRRARLCSAFPCHPPFFPSFFSFSPIHGRPGSDFSRTSLAHSKKDRGRLPLPLFFPPFSFFFFSPSDTMTQHAAGGTESESDDARLAWLPRFPSSLPFSFFFPPSFADRLPDLQASIRGCASHAPRLAPESPPFSFSLPSCRLAAAICLIVAGDHAGAISSIPIRVSPLLFLLFLFLFCTCRLIRVSCASNGISVDRLHDQALMHFLSFLPPFLSSWWARTGQRGRSGAPHWRTMCFSPSPFPPFIPLGLCDFIRRRMCSAVSAAQSFPFSFSLFFSLWSVSAKSGFRHRPS